MGMYDKAVQTYIKIVNKPAAKSIGKKFDKYWTYMSGEQSEMARKKLVKTIASIRKDKRFISKTKTLPLYKHKRYRTAYKNVLKADLKRTGAIGGTIVGSVGVIRGLKEL